MTKILDSTKTYFYKDKPLFGIDVGFNTLRVMQLDTSRKRPVVKGYGSISYASEAFKDGIIDKPELIAESMTKLFKTEMIGQIETKCVAVSLPVNKAFTRAVQLPKMSDSDLQAAIETEAAQYIPMGLERVYLDYTKIGETTDELDIFVVAMPKNIVDSYLSLTKIMGLEAVLVTTTVNSCTNVFARDEQSNIPSLLIDFGTKLTDISIFNKNLVVTSTVSFGGDDITNSISRSLNIPINEAIQMKSQYGLSASDVRKKIIDSIEPSMEQLLREIRRNIRYYQQRYTKEHSIGQIVTMGGGANMPGLAEYLTEKLLLPSRTFDISSVIEFGQLHPIYQAERASYITAAGLALTNPVEIFK